MKARFYTLIALYAFLTVSCKSIDKMVEKGQYDEALTFAVDKLAGEKDKKTKYVKGLETAFAKLNSKDQNEIDKLLLRGKASDWERVYGIYQNMDRRQSIVDPLLPLVSEDGYIADFHFVNYNPMLSTASKNIASQYYALVSDLLLDAENNGNKLAARDAYYMTDKVSRYSNEYADIKALKQKAYELGIYHIGIDIQNNYGGMYNFMIEDKLNGLNISRLNTQWNKFEYVDASSRDYDKYVVVKLEGLDFGPEKETVNNFEVSNKIQDGYKVVKDRSGKPILDSLGKEIVEPNFENVSAWVTEIFREKKSSVSARIELYDDKASYAEETIPIYLVHEFNDSAVKFRGDRRALNSDVKSRLDDYLSNFPTDIEAINFLGSNLVAAVENTTRALNIRN